MKVGQKRLLNPVFEDKDVVLWDVMPIEDGETILVTFESINSEWQQGVELMCDKGVEVAGEKGRSVLLWYETAPRPAEVTCRTKNGLLSIYNTWDEGRGPDSLAHTSGMLVEELPSGRRYRCHDFGFEPQFDKVVFRVERSEAG